MDAQQKQGPVAKDVLPGNGDDALIIFVKNLRVENFNIKLGNTMALEIYKSMAFHTYKATRKLNCDKFIFYSQQIEEHDIWSGKQFFKCVQQGENLGDKMCNAFEQVFDRGYKQIITIGSDCLEITSEILYNSFMHLAYKDIILGPAKSGGYYSLGMKTLHKKLFENIGWNTPSALRDTMLRCQQLCLSVHLLQDLYDVDGRTNWKRTTLKTRSND